MNILMFTNTYTPYTGGVAQSVSRFAEEFRKNRHQVMVVAPAFHGVPPREENVIRFPALCNLSEGNFSVPVPVPGIISASVKAFAPDIIHSHHPFLLGDTALRMAAAYNIPVVFTHHTMYENYTHYVGGNSKRLKRFVIEMVGGYCNLCDAVIAPSQTIADLLASRGIKVPIHVIATGVDARIFGQQDNGYFRKKLHIPSDAFVIGHVGRLASEKNLDFLAEAVARFLTLHPDACFLIAGAGPSEKQIRTIFRHYGLWSRVYLLGVLDMEEIVKAYHAMDVFVFSSHSETQGIVLIEAMAAGTPVVALDAPGVREVVMDRRNGRLLMAEDLNTFVSALDWIYGMHPEDKENLKQEIVKTVQKFSMPQLASKLIDLYQSLVHSKPGFKNIDTGSSASARRRIEKEWEILNNIVFALGNSSLSMYTDKLSPANNPHR
jgi:glycosyltransferase involved in cell wall biosynthesis